MYALRVFRSSAVSSSSSGLNRLVAAAAAPSLSNHSNAAGHEDKAPKMGSVDTKPEADKQKHEGLDKAREDGARITSQAEGPVDMAAQAATTTSHIAQGVSEFAKKTAEMGSEALGRASETAKGMWSGKEGSQSVDTGTEPHKAGGHDTPGVDKKGPKV